MQQARTISAKRYCNQAPQTSGRFVGFRHRVNKSAAGIWRRLRQRGISGSPPGKSFNCAHWAWRAAFWRWPGVLAAFSLAHLAAFGGEALVARSDAITDEVSAPIMGSHLVVTACQQCSFAVGRARLACRRDERYGWLVLI